MGNREFKLRDFLEKGNIGPLKVGLRRNEIYTLLGPPEDWTASEKEYEASIWKYGLVQLAFVNDRVWYIALYPRGHEVALGKIKTVGYFPMHSTELEEFRTFLDAEKLKYVIDNELTNEDQTCFILESGVRILFDENQVLSLIMKQAN